MECIQREKARFGQVLIKGLSQKAKLTIMLGIYEPKQEDRSALNKNTSWPYLSDADIYVGEKRALRKMICVDLNILTVLKL